MNSTNRIQISVLSYIYGFEIDYELHELYESYLAADKYLLHHFSEAFFGYIKARLDAESSCLIYDQMIKIGEREELSLASVRTIIQSSEAAFMSEHFKQIDRETLISLLSLHKLAISEFDLITAVSEWVDSEVERQGLTVDRESRRKAFEPIKGYILFTALRPGTIANCKEIAELLTEEEIGSLLLHQLNIEKRSKIGPETSRIPETYAYCSVFGDSVSELSHPFSRSVNLSVNRKVEIVTIHSTYSESATNLSLKILFSKGVELGLKIENSARNGKLSFVIDPPFDVQPNTSYTLQITGDGSTTNEDQLSKEQEFNYKEFVVCKLSTSPGDVFHFVQGLEFWASD